VKIRQTVLLLAIMASFVSFNEASATGNVLLPPENSDKSNLPNLGLGPTEPAPAPPVANKPAEAPQPPAPVTTTKPVATSVTKPPAPYVPPRNYSAPKPYSITITLAKSSWANSDISAVSSQLGIPKAKVQDECKMAINGMVGSGKGSNSVTGNTTTSATIAYDGVISNATLTAYAVCDSAPKPATYSYMQRLGSKYGLPIGSAFCSPKISSRTSMRQVVMTRSANSPDSCTFLP
jgi:hypothetical protein